MRALAVKLLFPLGVFLLLGLRAGAQAGDTSPFVAPSAGGAPGQPGDGSSYELRGIVSAGENHEYCIFDPARKASQWVGLNEPGHPFMIKTADPAHDTVALLTADGRLLTLTLRESKVVQGFSPTPAIGMAPGAPQSALAAANMILNPTPEDNQRRLQSIADEVRRRRLLREEAARQAALRQQ